MFGLMNRGGRTLIPLSVFFDTQGTPGTHQSSHQVHSIYLMALIGELMV